VALHSELLDLIKIIMMTKEGWIKRKLNGNGIAWNKGLPNPLFQGKNNPKWKGGEVTLLCLECKGNFKVRYYRKELAHFCSRICSYKYRDEGKRTADKKIRQSWAYRKWREAVFVRDNFTCTDCGDKNYEGRGETLVIQADHIKPFALYPNLRFENNNGRTLCIPCHKKTGTWGRGAIFRRCIASA
jgi:5-methylcytosine-specific restriction endonuclease McrA